MTTNQVQEFVKLGYTGAQHVASRVNAGNANEFAAESVSRELERGIINGDLPSAILRVQVRCRLDLSALLALEDAEQREAVAAFAGGCMKFLRENPDED